MEIFCFFLIPHQFPQCIIFLLKLANSQYITIHLRNPSKIQKELVQNLRPCLPVWQWASQSDDQLTSQIQPVLKKRRKEIVYNKMLDIIDL